MVCYAFAVAVGETQTATSPILKNFNIMESDCDSIISDKSPSIRGAVKRPQEEGFFGGQHLWDIYHVWKGLKIEGANKWHLLSQLYKAEPKEFKARIVLCNIRIVNLEAGSIVSAVALKIC